MLFVSGEELVVVDDAVVLGRQQSMEAIIRSGRQQAVASEETSSLLLQVL